VSKPLLVLDASAIINLLGCGSPHLLLGALSDRCVVEENTLKEVIRDPFTNRSAEQTIGILVSNRKLTVQRMSAPAYSQYLNLVSAEPRDALGRGESAALAHANDISAVVVLDDRKARRLGGARFPDCPQWTSIGLFREASEAVGMSPQQIGLLIQLACEKARMHVLDDDRVWVEGLQTLPIGQSAPTL
jgi:predicted nucleic acid-binding protein